MRCLFIYKLLIPAIDDDKMAALETSEQTDLSHDSEGCHSKDALDAEAHKKGLMTD